MAKWFPVLDLIGDIVFKPGLVPLPVVGQLQEGWSPSLTADESKPPAPDYDNGDDKAAAKRTIRNLGLLTVAVLAAPALYIAYTGQKRGKNAKQGIEGDKAFLALEGASNRAVSLASALAPVAAFPASYIGVQLLEDAGYIRKGTGDAVQTIMTGAVIGPAIGNIIGSVVGPFVGKAK